MPIKPDPEHVTAPPAPDAARKAYAPPKLTRYGAVHALTRAGIASKNEGNPGQKRVGGSDPRMKENIVRVGTHPLGAGLYLFDYKPEFRAAHGLGRQFGMMADEVVAVLPAAVSRDASGYLALDYALLGVARGDDA